MRLIGARLQLAAKFAVSLALCVWLASGVAWSDLAHGAQRLSWLVLAATLALRFLCQIIVASRLHMLLGFVGSRLDRNSILKLNFAGLFIGNFLPSTVGGDAFKAVHLKRAGLDYGTTLPVLLLDRLMNLGAVLTLSLTVLFVPRITSLLRPGTPRLSHVVALAIAALAAVILMVLVVRSERFRAALVAVAGKITSLATALCSNPALLARAVAMSLASEIVSFTSVYLLAHALQPSLGLVEVFAVVGLVQVIVLLPVTLNGIGLQESAFVLLFSRVGLGVPEATLVALLVRFLSMLSSAPGALWLGGLRVSARQREQATPAAGN